MKKNRTLYIQSKNICFVLVLPSNLHVNKINHEYNGCWVFYISKKQFKKFNCRNSKVVKASRSLLFTSMIQ